MSFVHLHLHTEYSLLDGFTKIHKLMTRVKEMDMPAVAITDHGTMFGVVEFFTAAKAAGIKPIIGLESYLSTGPMTAKEPKDKYSTHLLLLAQNMTGYKNLLRIASASQLEGYYYHPRIDHEFLAEHSEGLIATSGCMAAEVPRMILNSDVEGARNRLDWYKQVFGSNNFFIELQDHEIPEIKGLNNTLLKLGKELDIPFVATNDTHYVDPGDWRYQDIMLAIQTGARLSDPRRFKMSDKTYYLRSPEEMKTLFGHIDGAIQNTLEIAERCNVDLTSDTHHLPVFPLEGGETAESQLRRICEAGLKRKYGSDAEENPNVRERIEKELSIIHTMGFDAYFLIVHDLIQHARSENIWYNVRGSGAGSMVAYVLDITPVDPLEFKLIFERFLNPERISMPDIDLDIQDDQRYKMLQYCSDKYGADRVSQIITFNTLGAKGAIRDVGRVMDIPLAEVDRICKLIPAGIKMPVSGKSITIKNCLEEVPEFKQAVEADPVITELTTTASEMEGVTRNVGTHAAGVIITDIPIVEYAPLHRPTSGSDDNPIKSVAQFEMNIVDRMGLLKIDFLGLVTLTVMQKCCSNIEKRHSIHFELSNIPTDDKQTFKFLSDGHTAGVFQLESSGMTRYIKEMKPKSLDNIIAMVALYRPGPMQFIPDYIACMHGEKQPFYRHEKLKPIFEETYGIPVYQEQIMTAAMELGGYTAAESDSLRKAISKKKKADIDRHKVKFINGCVANGIDQTVAENIFSDWEQFANYGFNKSHAADYGVLAVQTGYLKTHFTIEYMTAILDANRNDSNKIAFYINDCRTMGIEVLPPEINSSKWEFTVDESGGKNNQIRFGLGAVKNVGENSVLAITDEREQNGPFSDLNDFVQRVDLRLVGRRPLECLIKVGALDAFGERGALLGAVDMMINASSANYKSKDSGQFDLFDLMSIPIVQVELPTVPAIENKEKLMWERDLLGLFVSDHPLNDHVKTLEKRRAMQVSDLQSADNGLQVTVGGIVQSMRMMLTKKDSRSMCSISLEDIQGESVDVIFYPTSWERCQDIVKQDEIILVQGRLDNSRSNLQISASNVESLLVGGIPKQDADFVDSFSLDDFGEDFGRQEMNLRREPAASAGQRIAEEAEPWDSDAGGDDNWGSDPVFESFAVAPVPLIPESAPYSITEHVSDSLSEDQTGTSCCADAPSTAETVDEMTDEHETESVETESVMESEPIDEADETVEESVRNDIESPSQPEPEPAAEPLPEVEQPKAVEKKDLANAVQADETEEDEDDDDFPFPDDIKPRSRLLTLIFENEPDSNMDIMIRRMQRIHGMVSAYPGRDKLAFMIHDKGQVQLVEFPDSNTKICDELLTALQQELGEKNIRIEEY